MTQDRKPLIYLAVILPMLLGGGLAILLVLVKTYTTFHAREVPPVSGLLITLPALALWIPLSLLISNVVLFAVPPLRRVAETYAAQNDRPPFTDSQARLKRLTALFSVLCLPLIALGFYL